MMYMHTFLLGFGAGFLAGGVVALLTLAVPCRLARKQEIPA